ncbi:MAG: GNAT family N-acetyltransferase [Gammaproteobacteria bacterium]|nr:MAG: GNAT family N-acetyltransferase [Gammaproteobacteria bacterium]
MKLISANKIAFHIADWEKDKNALTQIRKIVFIEEQNVPQDMEWDGHDETAIHYLARFNDKVIACARLKTDGQIGRMAVLENYRRQGIGNKLLVFVIQHAITNNFKQLFLHAQVDAIPFYEKQSFIAHGDIFIEADIPHREMYKIIN